jgi:Uncharacterized protein conserved in bacteria
MATVSIYLNFMGQAEDAFNFYKKVFNAEFDMGIMYFKDMPKEEGMPDLSEKEKNLVLHVSLPIIDGTHLYGSDMLESMGHKLLIGNNTTISLDLDSRAEADNLYSLLSEGSTQYVPMSEQFWGYWGVCLDKFGIRWMFNVMN